MSHFGEFWPRRLEVFHRKRKITAKDWEGIWRRARQVNTKVKIELELGYVHIVLETREELAVLIC